MCNDFITLMLIKGLLKSKSMTILMISCFNVIIFSPSKCILKIFCSATVVNCTLILIGFSLTVKAATLIFISGRGSAISFAKEGKSGFIYNLVKS